MLIFFILLLVILLSFLHGKQQKVIIGIIHKINCLAATINNMHTKSERKIITSEV